MAFLDCCDPRFEHPSTLIDLSLACSAAKDAVREHEEFSTVVTPSSAGKLSVAMTSPSCFQAHSAAMQPLSPPLSIAEYEVRDG